MTSKSCAPLELRSSDIRLLRGARSRAAFARVVGVTPHTVYRWELPEGAKDGRRPRGAELTKLVAMASGGALPEATEDTSPHTTRSHEHERERVASPRVDDDVMWVMPAFDRVFESDWARAHGDLLHWLGSSKDISVDALALAQTGAALVLALHRSDARGAFSSLAPALARAEEGTLQPFVAIKVYGAAAFVHGMSDGALFDIGRVHAYLARAEAIGRVEDDREALFVGWLGAIQAATVVGDQELVMRAARRLEETKTSGLRPLFSLVLDEVRSFCTYIDGISRGSRRNLLEIANEAAELGFPAVHARALGTWAVKQLDELRDPEEVVALGRKVKDIARMARLGPGMHTVFAVRAEADALLRMARIDEAMAVLHELEAYLADTGLPPTSATSVLVRAYFLTGREDALRALAKRFSSCQVVSLRPIVRAHAAYIEAMAELVAAHDPEGTVAAFAIAEVEGQRWNFLLRDVLVFGALAHAAFATDVTRVKIELRKAQRFLEICPSPWGSAHLRRVEGTVAAFTGHPAEAKRHLEAAAATFELAKDRPAALMTRHGLLGLSFMNGEPGLEDALRVSEAELATLGILPPKSIRATIERSRKAVGRARTATIDPSRLAVAVERLAVRGVAPELVLRVLRESAEELCAVEVSVEALERPDTFAGHASNGTEAERSVFEIRVGQGSLMQLVAKGPLDESRRAELGILITCAELALDLAHRGASTKIEGTDTTTESEDDGPFVAASNGMRRLKSELLSLSASKATVIITGESGTGKEVVARTLVSLSQRKNKPYTVFNCAAVPRDLFEGQLFGYRRGAFTGATQDHAGVIRAADGGTLFLDEIGELPLDVQPKLLRFLENGEVLPLGAQKPIAVDVRIVAATHRNLAELVQRGAFREDLFYRLQVVPIHLSPLRERTDDVVPLAVRFLRDLSKAAGRKPPLLSSDARARLVGHPWPGNVRELRNVLDRTLAFEPVPEVLRARDLRF